MSGVLLALGYTALLLLLMRRIHFFTEVPGLPAYWISWVFVLKIAFGMGLWAVYTYIYPDRATADVFKYFDDSAHMFKALPDHPGDYLRMVFGIGNDTPEFRDAYYKDMSNWVRHYESNIYNDAHTIIRFNAVVRLVSFGEFHVHTVLAAFLSLTGMVGLYRAFVVSLPGMERVLMAVVFLLPSVLFWASGVLKESLLFFGFGLLVHLVFRMLTGRIRPQDPLIIAFIAVMLFFLKFYVLMSLLPALALLIWARRAVRPALWTKALVVYGVFALIGLNLQRIVPGMDILSVITMKQRDFIGLALQVGSGSFVMPTALLTPDIGSFISQMPYALYITFLGPLVHLGSGIFGIIAATENLFVLAFLVLCVAHHRPWKDVDGTLLTVILFYVIVLALVIGWTTPVMGAVVRYRTPLLPFLMIAGLLVLDRDRVINKWPWTRLWLSP